MTISKSNISSRETIFTQSSKKDKVLKIIIGDIMSLPAYELKKEYKKVFEHYALEELNKSINNNKLNNYSNDNKISHKSIKEIYQSPSRWKTLKFSFISLPDNDKITGYIALVSFGLAFLIKTNLVWLQLVGLIFLLTFVFSFLRYGLRFNEWNSYVKNTFFIVNDLLERAESYIDRFSSISDTKLHEKADIISENLIEDEVSSLQYRLKKVNLFNIAFAFFMSLTFVLFLGENSVTYIKLIANFLRLGNLQFVQQLNIEKLALFVLFPVGIAMSKDIVVSGLQQRNDRLRRSLVILKDRIEERNSN